MRISIRSLYILASGLIGATWSAGAARADAPAPVLLSTSDSRAARVFTDGVHAIGGLRVSTALGEGVQVIATRTELLAVT